MNEIMLKTTKTISAFILVDTSIQLKNNKILLSTKVLELANTNNFKTA